MRNSEKQNSKVEKKRIKPRGREQWIDHFRSWLVDIYIRPNSSYGPFRFFKRLSWMNLTHVVILIFHELDDNQDEDFTVSQLISTFDPHFKKQFYTVLEAIQFGEVDPETKDSDDEIFRLNPVTIAPAKLNLFGTKTSILLFDTILHRHYAAGSEQVMAGHEPRLDFSPIERYVWKTDELGNVYRAENERWKFFRDVFEPFDGKEGRFDLGYDLDRHFENLRRENRLIRAKGDKPKVITWEKADLINAAMHDVITMMDKEYLWLSKSHLLKSFITEDEEIYQKPANIFFVGKIFNRDDERFYGNYYYSPYFFIGGEQKKILKRQFMKMGGLIKGLKKHERLLRADFIVYPYKRFDDWFWNEIKNEENIEKIFAELNNEWPSYVRVFSENNLMSSATTILQEPFDNGSLGWVDLINTTKEQQAIAYEKLVCLHYLLQLGAPKKPIDCKNLTLIVNSLRVNGAVWMSACYVRENIEGDYKNSELDEVAGFIDQAGFDRGLHIQNGLLRETEKRIRKKSQKLYLRFLILITKYFIEQKEYGNIRISNSELIEVINRHLKWTTRVYPFDYIVISTNVDLENLDLENDAFQYVYNPYFDRLTGKVYLKFDEINKELIDHINLCFMEAKSRK